MEGAFLSVHCQAQQISAYAPIFRLRLLRRSGKRYRPNDVVYFTSAKPVARRIGGKLFSPILSSGEADEIHPLCVSFKKIAVAILLAPISGMIAFWIWGALLADSTNLPLEPFMFGIPALFVAYAAYTYVDYLSRYRAAKHKYWDPNRMILVPEEYQGRREKMPELLKPQKVTVTIFGDALNEAAEPSEDVAAPKS